jgi:hypothetical protein
MMRASEAVHYTLAWISTARKCPNASRLGSAMRRNARPCSNGRPRGLLMSREGARARGAEWVSQKEVKRLAAATEAIPLCYMVCW